MSVVFFHSNREIGQSIWQNPSFVTPFGISQNANSNLVTPSQTITHIWGGTEELKARVAMGYHLPETLPQNVKPFDYDALRYANSTFRFLNQQTDVVLNLNTLAGMASFEKIKPETRYEYFINPSYMLNHVNTAKKKGGQVLILGNQLILEKDHIGLNALKIAGDKKNPFLISITPPKAIQFGDEPKYKIFYWLGDDLKIDTPNIISGVKSKTLEVMRNGFMNFKRSIKAQNLWELCAKLILK